MKNNTTRFIPFLLAVCLVGDIAIGTFYANHFSGNKLGIINTSSNKLNALLRIIDDQYVDTVKIADLVTILPTKAESSISTMRSPAIKPTFSDGPP
jgi:carboxyl-terminal processing protease